MKNKTYKTVKMVSLKMVRENTVKYSPIANSSDVHSICREVLLDSAVERFVIIGIDNGNKPVVIHIQDGSATSSPVFASTIFKILLLSNATRFFIAHNHPGGSHNFSEADFRSTEMLLKAGRLLEIGLLDHLLYFEDASISMRSTSSRIAFE
jgi:DNA repair protein RadC